MKCHLQSSTVFEVKTVALYGGKELLEKTWEHVGK